MNSQKPQEVRDYELERGIKWNVIAQGLILATVIGLFTAGLSFGNRILDKFDSVTVTLTEIRDLIATVNTKAEINTNRIEHNEKEIEILKEKVSKL